MKKLLQISFYLVLSVSFAVGAGTPAQAGPENAQGYELFRQVCLKTPLQPTRSRATLGKLTEYTVKDLVTPTPGNILVTFQHASKKLGGGLREYKGVKSCNVGFRTSGRTQAAVTEVVNMVAATRGVSGQLPAKAKRQFLFGYKGMVLAVQYKGKRISILLSNK